MKTRVRFLQRHPWWGQYINNATSYYNMWCHFIRYARYSPPSSLDVFADGNGGRFAPPPSWRRCEWSVGDIVVALQCKWFGQRGGRTKEMENGTTNDQPTKNAAKIKNGQTEMGNSDFANYRIVSLKKVWPLATGQSKIQDTLTITTMVHSYGLMVSYWSPTSYLQVVSTWFQSISPLAHKAVRSILLSHACDLILWELKLKNSALFQRILFH